MKKYAKDRMLKVITSNSSYISKMIKNSKKAARARFGDGIADNIRGC